jgi:hypothetical protein
MCLYFINEFVNVASTGKKTVDATISSYSSVWRKMPALGPEYQRHACLRHTLFESATSKAVPLHWPQFSQRPH